MSDRERRRLPRATIIAVELTVFAALFIVSLVGLGYARERMDQIAAHVSDQVSVQVAERLGAEISYQSIAPSALRSLQVRELELRTAGGDLLLSARRVLVHYSLRTLLSTRNALDAVDRVELIGVTADVHLPRDRVPVLAALAGLGASPDADTAQNGMLPWPLELSEAQLSVTAGADRVVLDDLSLRLEPRSQPDGDRIRLNGRAELSASLADVVGHAVQVNTRVSLDGSLSTGQAGAEAVVRLGAVQSTMGTLEAQDFQAGWDGTTLRLATIEDRGPFALAITIDLQQRTLRFDLQADELRPLRFFRPSGPLEALSALLDTTVGGTVTVVVDTTVADPAAAVGVDGTIAFVAPPDLMPDLLPDLVDGPVQVTVTARGDPTTIMVAPLTLRTADATAHFTGSIDLPGRRAIGRLTVTDLDLDGRPIRASGEIEADGSSLQLALHDGALAIGDASVAGLTGVIRLPQSLPGEAETPAAPSLQVDLAGTLPASPDGRTAMTGSVTLGAAPRFAGRIHVEEMNAGALYRLVQRHEQRDQDTVTLTDGLIVSARLEGSAAPDQLEFSVSMASVAQVDGPVSARFSAIASRERLRIADLDLLVGDTIRAMGSAELAGDERLSFVGRISVEGEEVPGTIHLEAGDGITVRGPYGLVLEAWPGERLPLHDLLPRILGDGDGAPMPFRMSADGYPLPAVSERSTATARFAGTVRHPQTLLAGLRPDAKLDLIAAGVELTDSRLLLHNLPIGEGANLLEIELEYADDMLSAHRFRFTNEELILTGDGGLQVTTRDGLRASGQLLLRTGQERYDAAIEITPERLDLDVDVQRFPLHRLGTLPITGTASGRVHITGSIARPVVHAELTADDARLNQDDLAVAVAATYDGTSLAIDDLALDYRLHRIRGVAGRIDATTGAMELAGRYEGEYLGRPLALHLAVAGTGSVPAEPSPDQLFPLDAVLTVAATDVMVDEVPKPPWHATVRWADGGLDFAGGPLDGLAGRIAPDGSFDVVVSAPLPLQGTASGTLIDNELSAELALTALDLTVLNDLMHTSAMTVRAGTASGTLRVRGPVNDPDLYGVVQAVDVVIESTLTPERIGPIAFAVVADEKELTIGRTRAQSGTAPLALSGSVQVGHWSPVAYEFHVQTTTADGVPVDYRFGPIALDGLARGALTISGDGLSTHVAGAVSAEATRVFIDNADRGSAARRQPLTVDLQVTTGRGVELTWPSQELPILHTLLDDDQSVAIRYDGFSGDYSVVGDVEIRGGDLFFYNRSFYLREGMVSFAEDETRFDPVVAVRAETRERAATDETLRIYLDADARLSTFSPDVVRVSSDPPRPLPELHALLGAPFGNGVAGQQVDLLALAGGVVSQFGLVRPMERAVRQSLGLDLFSIRSELVENLLRTPLGVPTPDLLDNTTIVVGKYLGADLFFEALVRVESDDVSSAPELHTDLELSLEWATPFFLLEWSLLPSLTDPFFLTDNSLSLSWRFDY